MQYIYISDADNSPVLYFNTGLDPRSFARTKMSQSLTEPGYIVYPDGSHDMWKPTGVDEINGYMQFWGPLFNGERLDHLINDVCPAAQDDSSGALQKRQRALIAVIHWIRAKMLLGDTPSIRNPGAAFIYNEGASDASAAISSNVNGRVFFAPEHMSNRCLLLENSDQKQDSPDRFNSPDLKDLEATAFCAAVMLYAILAKTHPYPSANNSQDMRDGFFLPVSLAAPDLNAELAGLIQSALTLPVQDKKAKMSAADILTGILKILTEKENRICDISSLFNELTAEKITQANIERKNFQLKQSSIIKTKRFLSRNKAVLIVSSACFLFAFFITLSIIDNYRRRPTTAGMHPENVINAYFDAFSNMDFTFMEACILGADKNDINAAVSLTAVTKARQAYESVSAYSVIPASVWKENGGELPAPNVFGVTDLSVTLNHGSESSGLLVYRVDYRLWNINEETPYIRRDMITLQPDKKNNWRIVEIVRTERQ